MPAQLDLDHAARLRTVLLGTSPAIAEVRDLVLRASRIALPVLILGETGTGKELVAQSIHTLSGCAGAFVAVNCAAIPGSLAETELFGHERGAFTGAQQQRAGRIVAAHGGTLFLDEIEDLSPALQAALLRFLATGEVQRPGLDRTLCVRVRVVAASNRNLETLVREGRFRADLFYRLDVIRVAIPPLRTRREDIPELVQHVLAGVSKEIGKPVEVPSRVVTEWMSLEWPGNVRELENHVRRFIALSDDPRPWGDAAVTNAFPTSNTCGADAAERVIGPAAVSVLTHLLERHEGNLAAVARQLGVSRQAVWKQVRRAGLRFGTFRPIRSAFRTCT